jgi:hypothetical protein
MKRTAVFSIMCWVGAKYAQEAENEVLGMIGFRPSRLAGCAVADRAVVGEFT